MTVNTDVHGFVTSGGAATLKEDIATLYRLWDEVNHRSVGSQRSPGARGLPDYRQVTWANWMKGAASSNDIYRDQRLSIICRINP